MSKRIIFKGQVRKLKGAARKLDLQRVKIATLVRATEAQMQKNADAMVERLKAVPDKMPVKARFTRWLRKTFTKGKQ